MDPNEIAANENAERHHEVVIASLDEKLSKLKKRKDPAANFARGHLQTWRAQAQARLDAYRGAQPEYKAALAEHEAASLALETKRAELVAAFNEGLAPFASAFNEARKTLEVTTTRAMLRQYSLPYAGSDPGDTRRIAEHAHTLAAYEPGRSNRCADLVAAQRNIDIAEMVAAVVAESSYLEDDAQAAFSLRWQRWASSNGLDAASATPTAAE